MEERKDAVTQKREAELNELNAKIDLLKSKVQKASADAKLSFQDQIGRLENKRNSLQERIEELKSAGGEAWKDLRQGIEDAARQLRNAIDEASERFQ